MFGYTPFLRRIIPLLLPLLALALANADSLDQIEEMVRKQEFDVARDLIDNQPSSERALEISDQIPPRMFIFDPSELPSDFTKTLIKPPAGAKATALDWSPKGPGLAVAYDNGQVVIYNIATNEPLRTFVLGQGSLSPAPGPISELKWSPDNQYIAAVIPADKSIRIWTLRGQQVFAESMNQPVKSITWAPDGSYLGHITGDNILSFLNVQTRQTQVFQTQFYRLVSMDWSPQGKRLLTIATQRKQSNPSNSHLINMIVLFDVSQLAQTITISHVNELNVNYPGLDWSIDGEKYYVATIGMAEGGGLLHEIDAQTHEQIGQFLVYGSDITDFEISPSGQASAMITKSWSSRSKSLTGLPIIMELSDNPDDQAKVRTNQPSFNPSWSSDGSMTAVILAESGETQLQWLNPGDFPRTK